MQDGKDTERKNWPAMRTGIDFGSTEYLTNFCLESCLLTRLSVFCRWHGMHIGNAAQRKGRCEAHCCLAWGRGRPRALSTEAGRWGMAQDEDLEGSGRHLQLNRAHIMSVTGRAGTERREHSPAGQAH